MTDEQMRINLSDNVFMGNVDVHQNIVPLGECPSCSASNVKVMKCQEKLCTSKKFCELCHTNSRFSEGRFKRFDSGHGSGPFCAKCLISTKNQNEEKYRLERERVERERIERERVEVERERVERERIEEEEKELADRRKLETEKHHKEEKMAYLIVVPVNILFYAWLSESLFSGVICTIPIILMIMLGARMSRNRRIEARMKIRIDDL